MWCAWLRPQVELGGEDPHAWPKPVGEEAAGRGTGSGATSEAAQAATEGAPAALALPSPVLAAEQAKPQRLPAAAVAAASSSRTFASVPQQAGRDLPPMLLEEAAAGKAAKAPAREGGAQALVARPPQQAAAEQAAQPRPKDAAVPPPAAAPARPAGELLGARSRSPRPPPGDEPSLPGVTAPRPVRRRTIRMQPEANAAAAADGAPAAAAASRPQPLPPSAGSPPPSGLAPSQAARYAPQPAAAAVKPSLDPSKAYAPMPPQLPLPGGAAGLGAGPAADEAPGPPWEPRLLPTRLNLMGLRVDCEVGKRGWGGAGPGGEGAAPLPTGHVYRPVDLAAAAVAESSHSSPPPFPRGLPLGAATASGPELHPR